MNKSMKQHDIDISSTKELSNRVKLLESEVQSLEKQLRVAKSKQTKLGSVKEFVRKLSIVVLIVLTSFNFSFGVGALWLKRNIINTDVWVEKTTELIENPEIRRQISTQLTTQIFTQAEVESRLQNVLPTEIGGLSGPLTNSLEGFTTSRVDNALQSERFIQFWQAANRSAHAGIVSSLENGGTATDAIKSENIIYIDNKEVVFNIKPIFNAIKSRLSEQGLTFVDRFSGDRIAGTITVTEIDNMKTVLYAFNFIDKMALVFPLLGVCTAIGAMWLSRSRRQTLLWIAVAIALGIIAELQAVYLANFQISDTLSNASANTNSASAQAFYEIVTRDLITIGRSLMALTIIIALGTLLAGPSKMATSLRNKIGTFLTFKKHDSKAIEWLARHSSQIVTVIAVIGLALLFLPIGGGVSFAVAVVTATVLLCLMVLSIAQANK